MSAPMPSIYRLKPGFQALLRPAVARLHGAGCTANHLTLTAAALSLLAGLGLYAAGSPRQALWLLPLVLLLRMALNAADGLLAREHGQASRLGALLNELGDVLSDAALYLPLALLAPFDAFWVGAFIVGAATSELAGVLAATVGAERRHDGPMGKSDRAAAVGAIALWAWLMPLPPAAAWLLPLLVLLTAWTICNRVRAALKQG